MKELSSEPLQTENGKPESDIFSLQNYPQNARTTPTPIISPLNNRITWNLLRAH